MRINFFAHYLLILLAFLFTLSAQAQTTSEINLLLEDLIAKNFREIKVQLQDSSSVNENLKDLIRCSGARNDSALIYADRAIIAADNAGLVSKVSVSLQAKGRFYMLKENFSGATSCFINAIRIEEKLKNEFRIADLNSDLAQVYSYQEIFGKALQYNEKALSIYRKLKDTIHIARLLRYIGVLHGSREYCEQRTPGQIDVDQQTAIGFYQQALELYIKKGDHDGEAKCNANVGMAYNRMNQPEIALGYVEKVLEYYREKKLAPEISEILYNLSKIYNRLLRFDDAIRCLKESQEVASKERITDGIQFLYEAMAQTYENQHDYMNSLKYYKKYMILRDSIYNNEKSQQIFELETKYQTEKKQSEIERLTLVKQQRTLVIYLLIATFLIVSLLGYTNFRNIRNKKIIADQQLEIKEKQLLELVKERQLVAAKSVLQGEEAERSRLAGDLHDGLGGLLTGVKLKLSSMKENAIITSENLAHFNHALDLLDTSITEMRRVAHNLMPETLMHYGLKTALSDFIKQVEPEGIPIIRFSTFGEDLRYSKEIEITIYRISQELVTNAIKHSFARQIDIQLFTEADRICAQINDNGIGFDPEKPELSKTGKGLQNIRDRVTAFNGRLEIISQQGKGTECTIEFILS